jgi:UDP-GlcNAc:undecaprenyl-phosphate/decaprenyl-phosphate GlcNAc-1-phosphate transferase
MNIIPFVLFSTSFLFSFTILISGILLNLLGKRYFIDVPDARKLHKTAVPRIGGICFGSCFFILGLIFFWNKIEFYWYFVGSGIIWVTGILDDFQEKSWKSKLLIQLSLGIGLVLYFYSKVDTVYFFNRFIEIPKVLIFCLFFIWFIGMINSVNLTDGMDGLAGGGVLIVLIGSIVLGWFSVNPYFMVVNSMLASVLFAFLVFNKRPAKFFMGDGGSLLLGFHVAVLPLLFFSGELMTKSINMTPFVILSAYFIVDTLRVFYLRIRKKLHPLHPDKNHMHHNLLEITGSYNGTLFVIFLIISLSSFFAIIDIKFQFDIVAMFIFIIIIGVVIFVPNITKFFLRGCSGVILVLRRFLKSMKISKYIFSDKLIKICVISYLIVTLLSIKLTEVTFSYWFYILPGFLISFFLSILSKDEKMKKIILIMNIIFFIGVLIFSEQVTHMWNREIFVLKNFILYFLIFLVGVRFFFRGDRLLMRYWSIYDILFLCLMIEFVCISFFFSGFPIYKMGEVYILYLSLQIFYRTEVIFRFGIK